MANTGLPELGIRKSPRASGPVALVGKTKIEGTFLLVFFAMVVHCHEFAMFAIVLKIPKIPLPNKTDLKLQNMKTR